MWRKRALNVTFKLLSASSISNFTHTHMHIHVFSLSLFNLFFSFLLRLQVRHYKAYPTPFIQILHNFTTTLQSQPPSTDLPQYPNLSRPQNPYILKTLIPIPPYQLPRISTPHVHTLNPHILLTITTKPRNPTDTTSQHPRARQKKKKK
jgi:hypothetical protein